MAYTTIDDPSAYFQTALYAGNNTTGHSITNDGNSDLQPDWVWIKQRTSNNPHTVQDTSRGFAGSGEVNLVIPNTDGAEVTNGAFESFDSNGFTVGGTNPASGAYNLSGSNYVAWQWKANGGTTTSKSSTTIDTNVTTPCVQQVNTDAGFSIITYTASSSYAGTETHLEHGLGVGPRFLMVKRRDTAADWAVYHADNGGSPNAGYSYNLLNSTAATAQSSPTNKYWLNTPAESNATLLAFGLENGADGGEYVCYAFAEKQGYSKFGKYVGNGNANGTFVYTGFAPAFVMLKDTSQATNWEMFDVKRNPFNVRNLKLGANLAVDENGSDLGNTNQNNIDILSNGFKMRTGNTDTNVNGDTYIYMAFAENPFTTSTGIPTTAR